MIVYGPRSPCDGDWFGGISAGDAELFLDTVLTLEVHGLRLFSTPHCPMAIECCSAVP